jgi:anti-sigma regulatory factor (Ser/Thr protein kinase)
MLVRCPSHPSVAHRRGKISKTAMVDKESRRHENVSHRQPARRPLLELWLPADPQAVPAARHQVSQICLRSGISEDDCFALDVALGEALANAVVHGGVQSCEQPQEDHVRLCVWNFHDRLILEVHDKGPGFDPPLPPYAMPLADAQETHGRGLPLMQMLTDALIVCRGDAEQGGASIYLVKQMKSV